MTQPIGDSIGRIAIIDVRQLTARLANTPPCPDCVGGLAIEVFADGAWRVMPSHSDACPFLVRRQRLLDRMQGQDPGDPAGGRGEG